MVLAALLSQVLAITSACHCVSCTALAMFAAALPLQGLAGTSAAQPKLCLLLFVLPYIGCCASTCATGRPPAKHVQDCALVASTGCALVGTRSFNRLFSHLGGIAAHWNMRRVPRHGNAGTSRPPFSLQSPGVG